MTESRDSAKHPRGRLDSLDGLRALAVPLIFLGHVDQTLFKGGTVGVVVFFVLSGYLITWLLLRERDRSGTIAMRRFYMRRFLRLYPALVTMIAVITPIAFIDHVGRPPLDSLAALLYVSNIWSNYSGNPSLTLHTWTLGVEEQFYLVWPVVILFLIRRRIPLGRTLVASMALALLSSLVVYHVHRLFNPQYLPVVHVFELAAGALLAVIVRGPIPAALRLIAKVPFAGVSLAAIVAAEVLLPHRWWTFALATAICFPLIAHLVLDRGSVLVKCFSARPFVWLGRRSYAVYLWHYPILLLLARSVSDVTERAFIGFAITMTVVVLSWRFVETPFLRLKDERFASRGSSATGVVEPQPAAAAV